MYFLSIKKRICMELTIFEFVSGLSSLIFSIISVILGLTIMSKYRKYKQKTLLYIGFTLIGLVEPWWASAGGFISVLVNGKGLPPQIHFLLGNILIPLTIFLWLAAMTELQYKSKQKPILFVFGIEGIVFEIFFLYFLFTDVSIIGEVHGAVDVEYRSFTLLYIFQVLITALITGLMFARESMRSENPEIRLKGKLLAIAFLCYIPAGIFDASATINIIILVILRLVEISAAFAFYGGFLLPNWMKNLLLKQK